MPDEIKNAMKSSVVVVICVSRGYKLNPYCQKVARYAMTLQHTTDASEKRDVLFVLIQGDYTMSSVPNRIDGWLGHMMKGKIISMLMVCVLIESRCCVIPMLFQHSNEDNSFEY